MSEKIAVHCPTQESYDRLMKAYEKNGWLSKLGYKPTERNYWTIDKEKCHITFHDEFTYGTTNGIEDYTIITVEEALARLGQYERGQRVLVRDSKNYNWEERIYITTIEGDNMPYTVVPKDEWEEYCTKGTKFNSMIYKYIKPLEEPIKEMTIQELEEKLGHRVKIVK